MTEALGRGIVQGIELTKPELLQVIIQLGLDSEGAIEEFTKALTDGRMMMALGSENFGVVANSCISGSAVITCGMSGIGLTTTTDPTAKGFYALSCLCSGTSAATGGMAVLARKCEVSEVALLTEAFGAAFLYLGNKAHAVALRIERKPVPRRFRRPIAGFGVYNRQNNVAFINPTSFRCSGIIETIPFEQIGRAVGFSISVYFYGRIILSAYRYGQQLMAKSKHKKFLKATKLFMSLTCIRIQSTKRRRLYHFVVS